MRQACQNFTEVLIHLNAKTLGVKEHIKWLLLVDQSSVRTFSRWSRDNESRFSTFRWNSVKPGNVSSENSSFWDGPRVTESFRIFGRLRPGPDWKPWNESWENWSRKLNLGWSNDPTCWSMLYMGQSVSQNFPKIVRGLHRSLNKQFLWNFTNTMYSSHESGCIKLPFPSVWSVFTTFAWHLILWKFRLGNNLEAASWLKKIYSTSLSGWTRSCWITLLREKELWWHGT